jgi:GNAT superfamily N-acetyltransferase
MPLPRRLHVEEVALAAILPMREEYRGEMNCQIVHDSWHARGFTRSYACRANDEIVGYGSVGGAPHDPQDTVKEFYVRRPMRRFALPLFRLLVETAGGRTIEAQTNDVLMTLMLFDCATSWQSETILFHDALLTTLPAPRGVTFRPIVVTDRADVFEHARVPVGDWGLEHEGRIVATGGLLFHYNPPYGDIHMAVDAACRRLGYGSYLVQELKRVCRGLGKVPAARCPVANVASRRTLESAGLQPCARILRGTIAATGPAMTGR